MEKKVNITGKYVNLRRKYVYILQKYLNIMRQYLNITERFKFKEKICIHSTKISQYNEKNDLMMRKPLFISSSCIYLYILVFFRYGFTEHKAHILASFPALCR